MAGVEVDFCGFNEEVSHPPRVNGRLPLYHAHAINNIQRDAKDPLVGVPVTITGLHDLKGYHGLVKTVCGSGNLQIELEATLRVVQVQRHYVSIRYQMYNDLTNPWLTDSLP